MEKNNKSKYVKFIITVIILLSWISFDLFSQNTVKSKLVYEWYTPDNQSSYPAVLVLGGAEGGLNYGQQWAKVLTKNGFGVMALAYFGVKGLDEQLEEIPYEYFQSALDTLKTFKGVKSDRISIISVSKGTEIAFLLAIENKSIRLVIAASPSNVIWQSINQANYGSVKSSWTKGGKPLPFVPYDYKNGFYPLVNLYMGVLNNPIDEETIIPLEKSNTKIVLFSGGQDQVWPSKYMSDAISNRLKTKHHDGFLLYYNYPFAGHGFLIPFQSADEKKKIMKSLAPNINFLGGTVEAYDEAMTESYKIVLNELLKLKNDNF